MVLTVLGVIGKILLILLYIVLILLCLILFVPIRYNAKVRVRESVKAGGHAYWLFRLVHILLKYDTAAEQDRRLHIQIRLAGHVLFDNLRPHRKHRKKKKQQDKAEDGGQTEQSGQNPEKAEEAEEAGGAKQPADAQAEKIESTEQPARIQAEEAERAESAQQSANAQAEEAERAESAQQSANAQAEEAEKAQNTQKAQTEAASKPEKKPHRRSGKRRASGRSFGERFRSKLIQLQRKAEAIKKKKDQVMAILNNPDNRICVSRIFRNLKKLLYRLRPELKRLYLHFGFEDPAATGKMLGAVSWLYPFCTDAMEVVPEFQTDKLIFESDVQAEGRIRLIWPAVFAVTSLLNRRFFRLVKQIRNIL
ncbi:MAG: hypothetical protein ACOX74_00500 [Lachnospiraceae bacterium]